jgi:DNA-directed RNA polymerase subunit RPC12/RpoP
MMGRIDVQRLTVPADFAAIFEQRDETPAVVKPEAPPPGPVSTSLAENNCSGCGSRLSAVEAKMGRCLTCGKTFADGKQVTVGL